MYKDGLVEISNHKYLFIIAALCYALAFLIAVFNLQKPKQMRLPIILVLLVCAFLVQSMALYVRGLQLQAFPLSNPFEVLQVLAWSAIALDLILRPLFHLRLLNLFASGLAAILCSIALCVPVWDYVAPVSTAALNPWVGFHAALAVFSYGVFAILGLTSMMFLIQHRGLRAHRSGRIFSRLPAIRQLEQINSKLIVLGVSVLTISVAIGTLNWLAEPGFVSGTKFVVAIVIWLAYIVVLLLRKSNRLMATRYAWTCLILFIFVLISLWPLAQRSPDPIASPDPMGLLNDANG